MNISSAIFECSAPDLESCPDGSLPEFAFIGRSNVGKSSLINMLTGQHALARVSPVPGFTKLINTFTINQNWRLVDLPGYGFAQVATADSSRFNQAVAKYLMDRTSLCFVFALLDSGLSPQEIDLEFVEWLTRNSIPFVLVFTKADRATPAEVQANIAAFEARISPWFVKPPEIYICSAKTKQGRPELLALIDDALKGIEAEETPHQSAAPGLSSPPKMSPRERRRKRPDLNRPW